MPKEKKPGWSYFFSEYFNEEFAIHDESGWVYFSTKEGIVKYSPAEFELLNKHGLKLDLATHRIKTILGGELVDIKPIPKPPEPATRPGELEIW